MTPLWSIRLLFLTLCILGGYAVSQVRPEYVGQQHGEVIGGLVIVHDASYIRRVFIFGARRSCEPWHMCFSSC